MAKPPETPPSKPADTSGRGDGDRADAGAASSEEVERARKESKARPPGSRG